MENNEIRFEELVKQIIEEFDNIMEIYIEHRASLDKLNSSDDTPMMLISIHTIEADSSADWRDDLVDADYVAVDIEEKVITIPFDIYATDEVPGHMQHTCGTTIYMTENITERDSHNVETGLEIFRNKLAGRCPTCGESVDDPASLTDHYQSSRECIKQV
jgi:hypothetical protein